jgi:NAD(P)-dependent dehydrogenase (short-subunit alcohol dehydrogenase family)
VSLQTTSVAAPGQAVLPGQTVVVIGGSSGIGLETARRARAEGANVILTGRDPARLTQAGLEVGALSTAAFDATDKAQLEGFFASLPERVDHVMVTAGGAYYAPLAEIDDEQVRRAFDEHLLLAIQVARLAVTKVHPSGTLVFMTGTSGRRPGIGMSVGSVLATAVPVLVENLALEIAPIRVNVIAAGFVDTSLSASLLGDDLKSRLADLRATLPVRRVVEPGDVAALAIHLMSNTLLTGGTYDIDGGEKLIGDA